MRGPRRRVGRPGHRQHAALSVRVLRVRVRVRVRVGMVVTVDVVVAVGMAVVVVGVEGVGELVGEDVKGPDVEDDAAREPAHGNADELPDGREAATEENPNGAAVHGRRSG